MSMPEHLLLLLEFFCYRSLFFVFWFNCFFLTDSATVVMSLRFIDAVVGTGFTRYSLAICFIYVHSFCFVIGFRTLPTLICTVFSVSYIWISVLHTIFSVMLDLSLTTSFLKLTILENRCLMLYFKKVKKACLLAYWLNIKYQMSCRTFHGLPRNQIPDIDLLLIKNSEDWLDKTKAM